MKSTVAAFVAMWIACTLAAAEPVELFNGTDLSGWKKLGGAATYAVEDGEIVGRSVPNTSNTFLATEREFGDFELELEFKIDDPAFNSGVQIRSHSRPENDQQRVYGYQVEIDPRPDRAWTAGIYFEGGSDAREAGWLNDLSGNEAARKAFKLGEWNSLRIVANGRRIQTWLNGVPAADFMDEDDTAFTPAGFIALQVHDVGAATEPKEVRWRNIKLTELDTAQGQTEPPSAAEKERSTGLQLFGRALGAMFGLNSGRGHGEDEFLHLVGGPAPNFELETLAGERISLKDLQGKVVLLDFWATWCGPCMLAMPKVEKVHQALDGQAVAVFGVNQQEKAEDIREAIKDRGITFGILLDEDGSVGDSFGASAIPHTVLIDQQGKIQWIHEGYSAGMEKQLLENISKLLRGENLYDEQKVAEARVKREKRKQEILAKIELQNADRLEAVGEVLADAGIESYTAYNPAQPVKFPAEEEQALVLLSGENRLAIIRPNAEQAETIKLELPEDISLWDFCPVRVGDQIAWAGIAADYDDDYQIEQMRLFLFGADGKPVWTNSYALVAGDGYPDVDLVATDLTGDENEEIAIMVKDPGLAEIGGPKGSTRTLSVYDSAGKLLLRAWVPGNGQAIVLPLATVDGNRLLMATDRGLTKFRVNPSTSQTETEAAP